MGIINIVIYTAIAIFYNIFVHHITSMIYRDMSYDEKYRSSLTFIFVAGIATIVMAKFVFRENKRFKNPIVYRGLNLGGILLILTSLLINWENMGDEIKLVMTALTVGGLLWLSYKYFGDDNDKDEKDDKDDKLSKNGEDEILLKEEDMLDD